jgi:hypothetical protein
MPQKSLVWEREESILEGQIDSVSGVPGLELIALARFFGARFLKGEAPQRYLY